MNDQPMPICISCKVELNSNGYDVVILKGKLFHKMPCIYGGSHCEKYTTHLGTIEKADAKRKVELARA